jgi:hypothetical protein
MPSQTPVCPHDAALSVRHSLWGSAFPAATGQQVPIRPLWLQLTQAPRHATLQHSPSVQKPEAHSASLVHTAPRGLGPQLPFTHFTPATQSPSERQVVVHVVVAASQLNGLQIVAGPGLQRP